MQVNLTGGGEQFLLEQAQSGSHAPIMWVCMNAVTFRFFRYLRLFGLPGGSFISWLLVDYWQIVGLLGVEYGVIERRMSADFSIAVHCIFLSHHGFPGAICQSS